MSWGDEWDPEDVEPWHPRSTSPEGMPAKYRDAWNSYRHVIWNKGDPRNLGELKLSNLREVLNRVCSLLATDEDEIEMGEVFWVGAMMSVAALRLRPPDFKEQDIEDELDATAEEMEAMAISCIVYRIHEWNGGLIEEDD